MKYKIHYKELKTIEIDGINENDAKNNFIKHLNRKESLPWNISIYDINEVKILNWIILAHNSIMWCAIHHMRISKM